MKKRLEFVFEFYHTRNIVRDRLGMWKEKKMRKKGKKEEGRTKREEYVILLEKKK